MQRGMVSKLKMAVKEQLGQDSRWNPTTQSGNPCCSPLVDFYMNLRQQNRSAWVFLSTRRTLFCRMSSSTC